MALVVTDTLRRLVYCASEMGENLTVEASGTTVNSELAYNGVMLAPGTSLAAAKTHCVGEKVADGRRGEWLKQHAIKNASQHIGLQRGDAFAHAIKAVTVSTPIADLMFHAQLSTVVNARLFTIAHLDHPEG